MVDAVIVGACRTPVGNLNGSLSSLKAHELGCATIKAVLKQCTLNPDDVTGVILGQVLTAAQGQNPARQAALAAGIPYTCPAYSINMLCGSGLKAVVNAAQDVMLDRNNIIICGGQESMSQAPHAVNVRSPMSFGDTTLVDTCLKDGLLDGTYGWHMGVTAENVVQKYEIKREEQDEFAVASQQKARNAVENDWFDEEIVPITVKTRKSEVLVKKDEFPKPNTTIEALQKLRPAFSKDGTVTAGNASGINDGAAVVVVMSREQAEKRSLKPLARIVAYSQVGLDPAYMGMGPVTAINVTLKKAGWRLEDVDLFELNEAFAAQSVACMKELKLNPDKVNVHGGAIALGHPIGASGARILVSLLYALKRSGSKKGIAALCIGGGMGIAMAVQVD